MSSFMLLIRVSKRILINERDLHIVRLVIDRANVRIFPIERMAAVFSPNLLCFPFYLCTVTAAPRRSDFTISNRDNHRPFDVSTIRPVGTGFTDFQGHHQ